MHRLVLLITLFSATAFAEFSSQGEVAVEYRQFKNDDVSSTQDTGIAFFSRLESSYEDDRYSHVLRGFSRIDSKESSRDLIWVEDAYAAYFLDEEKLWKISGGYKVFNWTALEAFQPADTINSRNFDAPLERPEKRGELALELEVPFYQGSLTFSFFPRVENPRYPGSASRLGVGFLPAEPVWVDGQDAKSDQWHPQFAARLTQLIYGADLSLHVLRHYDRQFPIVGTSNYAVVLGNTVPVNGVSSLNVPHFYEVTQIGGTLQKPFFDAWLFKAEAANRTFEKDLSVLTVTGLRKPLDHTEAALGLEYMTSHADGSDSTLFFEYQKILGLEKSEAERLSIFQHDYFIGIRHTRNDIMGTEFVLSAILDVDRSHEKLYNFQASRRLSDVWKIGTTVRVFDAPKQGTTAVGLEVLDQDHHISINLSRFF